MWTDRTAGLDAFETLSWQRPQAISGSALGRALHLPSPTAVEDLRQAEDARLSAARREGLSSALLVPIRDGVVTIAMIELLSRSGGASDAETTIAIEAVALQLGQLAHLLRMSATPHWRLGRL
jgi:hypothetical protein